MNVVQSRQPRLRGTAAELFTTSLRLAARGRFARLDDASETVIRRRLETYESETMPVLEFYSEKLTTIDATQVLLKVTNEVTSVILSSRSRRGRTEWPSGGVLLNAICRREGDPGYVDCR